MKKAGLIIASALLVAGVGLGLTVDSSPTVVHVSIEYGTNGEAETVTLTDQNGRPVQTGSIAESWEDDNTDAE